MEQHSGLQCPAPSEELRPSKTFWFADFYWRNLVPIATGHIAFLLHSLFFSGLKLPFLCCFIPPLPPIVISAAFVGSNQFVLCLWLATSQIPCALHFFYQMQSSDERTTLGSRSPASFWGKLGFPVKLFSWGWCISERLV